MLKSLKSATRSEGEREREMAMILDAFAGRCSELLEQLITEEAVRVLGVKKDLRRLKERLEVIKDVLSDAERMRIQEASVNRWLSKLKDVMYDADDIIDLCRIRGSELLQGDGEPQASTSSSSVCCHFPCFTAVTSIPLRCEVGRQIKKLNKRLEEISQDQMMFGLLRQGSAQNVVATQVKRPQTCALAKSNVVGRQTKMNVKRLVDSLVKADNNNLLLFAITGQGGIGKTTLAQKIYNHLKVQSHFKKRFLIWVCVSQNFSETELLKQIIRSAGGDYGRAETKAELQPLLKSTLEGNRFLLVLDDVWRADDLWKDLLQTPLEQAGMSGGRVLITTRNEDVAKLMHATHTHKVEKLSASDGWELLWKSVFKDAVDEDVQNLHGIGMQIVEKCDGLPLAIEVVAGVLTTKVTSKREWENVYKSHAWAVAEQLPEAVRGALYFSYEDLPSHLKQCFLLCSLFSEDASLLRADLLRYWVAEGFIPAQGDSLLEDVAENCYNDLISRCLLCLDPHSLNRRTCQMHDLTHSLTQVLTKDESQFVDGNEQTVDKSLKLRRLAINNKKESTCVLNEVKNPKYLRTLHIRKCLQINLTDLFQRFTHLRVLNLTESNIESIPESIQNLHHLRYLDLDRTKIHVLPDSIGCLPNLQFLNLQGCKSLNTLPKSITQLHNLRRLGISETPISHVPVGIGKLEHLNDLEGFVVGSGQHQVGCDLNELQSMSKLRSLAIESLERVQSRGIQPLKDKCYLKKLKLSSSGDAGQSLVPERIEQIFEDLSPHINLENLFLMFFCGCKFPEWLDLLPNLTALGLYNCLTCQELPPLGQLPQLRILYITGADSVVAIGPKFLGFDRKDDHGHHGTPAAFPKLEQLIMESMPKWEEWECDVEEVEGGRGTTIKLLPRLQELRIDDCPKLKALPQGLKNATSLKSLIIVGADSLREIKNIPSLEEELCIVECQNLERISHLPALRTMKIRDSCRTLKFVENLDSLQTLSLELEDEWTEYLPEWLLGLVQRAKVNGELEALFLFCSEALVKRSIIGGEYWPILNHIPDVSVFLRED